MKLSENSQKKSIVLALVIVFVPPLLIIIGSLISRYQATIALHEAEREIYIEWFGDDDSLHQHMRVWEESGLVGLGIINQAQYDAIIYSFTSDDFVSLTETSQSDVEALLTGGFPLIGEYGSEGHLNAERFLSAIGHIESILRLSIAVEDLNIRYSWRTFSWEMRDEIE